jgi:diguanylate cyclase (GGDEF)-like protein/PAS domain S-box-containing protein
MAHAKLPADPSPDPASLPSSARSTLDAASLTVLRKILIDVGDPAQTSNPLKQAIGALETVERLGSAIVARYRSLVDAIPDAITLHDENGRILDANESACRTFGYSLDQLKRMSVFDLNTTLPSHHMEQIAPLLRIGETSTVSTINRRSDGSVFPVEVHSRAYDEAGEMRIVAVARDITLRNADGEKLRASEDRYRSLLQAMDKGVVVSDASGRTLSANPAACRIFGMSETELIARSPEQLQHMPYIDGEGHDLQRADQPLMRALSTGRAVADTLIGIHLPHLKATRWLSVTSVPQLLQGETVPFQVISTFTDVTALKRQAQLFAMTQTLAAIGGWEIDLANEALFWTEETYRIHDVPEDSAMTVERALGFFPADDRDAMEQALRVLRRSGAAFVLELRITTAIGRRRWVRLMGQALWRQGEIYAACGTLQDVTERKLIEDQLRLRTLTDTLTGLSNREALLGLLEHSLRVAEFGGRLALIVVDLDRFKVANDLLGHAAGDKLLIAAAERLKECVAVPATIARFGGDEFVVLLDEAHGDATPQAVADRIAQAFGKPFTSGDDEFNLTASIGIARFPEDGETSQQLMMHADAAMHEAKRRGGNIWQGFTPALARRISERTLIESQLRRALDNGELHLHYQPIMHLATTRMIGAEALLRWRSPLLGDLAPDRFIHFAENTGDIVRIGAWVLRESCRQLRQWREQGLALEHVAVNVSYRQLLSGTLAESVAAALNEFDLPGTALELEMTERVLIEDVTDTDHIFAMLKGLGVGLLIDDFGEGYSALNYLRRLPIDGLKISYGFMQGIPGNPTDAAICEAVIRMARSLGLKVIAEGVENEQQRQFLIDHGCELAQGFLFSHPLAPDRLAAFFNNRRRNL